MPESSVIIDYLALHHPGAVELVPASAELAWQARLQDRFYDLYVAEPMQKIVTDRLRPPGRNDPHGAEAARTVLRTAYGVIERAMAAQTWAAGEAFTVADCAAAPALFYADWVEPFGASHPNVAAYLHRLLARPSIARVVEQAKPYRPLFPQERR